MWRRSPVMALLMAVRALRSRCWKTRHRLAGASMSITTLQRPMAWSAAVKPPGSPLRRFETGHPSTKADHLYSAKPLGRTTMRRPRYVDECMISGRSELRSMSHAASFRLRTPVGIDFRRAAPLSCWITEYKFNIGGNDRNLPALRCDPRVEAVMSFILFLHLGVMGKIVRLPQNMDG